MKKDRTGAYTLVELLIAIAVVVLLLAILSPVFPRMRQTGIQAQCAANLRQFGVLFGVYVADHNGVMPVARLDYLDADGKAKTDVWFRYLYPYVNNSLRDKDHPYMVCPARQESEPYPYSYAMERSAGSDTKTFTNKPTRLADLQLNLHNGAPVDGQRWILIDGGWYFLDSVKGLNDLSGAHKTPVFRHKGRLCVLLPDFSVEAMTREEMNARLYIFRERPIPGN